MLFDCLDESDFELLRSHLRKQQSHQNRPVFIFPCGGEEKEHLSRKLFRDYIQKCRCDELNNVFCLTAEDIAQSDALKNLNLLQQEAMLADISDLIFIFAESVGSFCELGAFSSLPHASAITALAIDRKFEFEHSFLNEGPAQEIMDSKYPFNRVFYLDLNNPFSSAELCLFISEIRKNLKLGENRVLTEKRKTPNSDQNNVQVGALAHEILDLLQLFGPLSKHEIVLLYKKVKEFRKIKIISRIISEDMKRQPKCEIKLEDVLSMLVATGLVIHHEARPKAPSLYSSAIHIESYFMFANTDAPRFAKMRAKVLLKMRSYRKGEMRDVYRKSNR